ncbi:hypothetical protein C8R47DRAFT_635884 [Mycena vitilis]|nr:hypothetical protein C8R47DRAFT_635884 [Mycena vitilis]
MILFLLRPPSLNYRQQTSRREAAYVSSAEALAPQKITIFTKRPKKSVVSLAGEGSPKSCLPCARSTRTHLRARTHSCAQDIKPGSNLRTTSNFRARPKSFTKQPGKILLHPRTMSSASTASLVSNTTVSSRTPVTVPLKDFGAGLAGLQSTYGFGGSAPSPVQKQKLDPPPRPTASPTPRAPKNYAAVFADLQLTYGLGGSTPVIARS